MNYQAGVTGRHHKEGEERRRRKEGTRRRRGQKVSTRCDGSGAYGQVRCPQKDSWRRSSKQDPNSKYLGRAAGQVASLAYRLRVIP